MSGVTEAVQEALQPRIIPLPPLPASVSSDIGEAQWTTLMAIMDTVIPSLQMQQQLQLKSTPSKGGQVAQLDYNLAVEQLRKTAGEKGVDEELLKAYLRECPSEIAVFGEVLKRTLTCFVREKERSDLGNLLVLMNTRIGSFLLTGYKDPFHLQSLDIRTAILQGWRTSYIPALAGAFKTLTFIAKNIYIKSSPTFASIAGFPRHPTPYKPGNLYEYEFLQLPPGNKNEPEILETDVLILGSGCGGSVCAANIAKAGLRVLVVDKGYYHPPATMPMTEVDGGVHLFDNGGFTAVDDGSLSIIAGSTWGGGGTINWSASLQPQYAVRKEWAEDRGLKFFQGEKFQDSLDRVCARMGVSDKHIRHNHGNLALIEGSRKLGMACKAVPQNTGGEEHYCGHCALGCGAGVKQGPATTWLADAANSGAIFMEGMTVEKVLFEDIGGKKVAVGVKGIWAGRDENGGVDGTGTVRNVVVRAKKVILSCGTLWSPIVLLKSGLKNPHIGRNLYLHPVNIVVAVYDEDVRPWEGGILTSVTTSLEDLDTHFHGVKLETTAMLPSWILTFLNWTDGVSFKLNALKYRHMNGFISITRDRDTGRVYPDAKEGLPRIEYTPSKFDRKHTLQGVLALCKVALVSGAREIRVAIDGVEPYISKRPVSPPVANSPEASLSSYLPPYTGVDDELSSDGFQTWLQSIEKIGNAPPAGTFACAHQMGSNRMSAQPRDGVVDAAGLVWGTEGLYVADASVFPSASGVNPMVTNMAISDWISRGVVAEMRGEERARL